MSGGDLVDADDKNVLVTKGDVTTIRAAAVPAGSGDAVAAGGEAVAVSLSADQQVLNVAFMTGGGDAQIIQVRVPDLVRARRQPGGAAAPGDEEPELPRVHAGDPPAAGADSDGEVGVVIEGDLTTISEATIAANGGAATSVSGIAVAADLDGHGQLTLTFVDAGGDLQMIATNVAGLL